MKHYPKKLRILRYKDDAMNKQVILYDDHCPMCKAYTQGFVELGILEAENRVGFSQSEESLRAQIDLERGRHEIPLYDRETQTTRYGLEALTFLLGSRWTWMKPIIGTRIFRAALYPLYQLITYNRRLIAGTGGPTQGFDCAPDFNPFWRSVYLVLALGLSLWIFMALGTALPFELPIVGGLLPAALLAYLLLETPRKKIPAWDYWGNLLTVGLIGALLMLPALWGTTEPLLWVVNGAFSLAMMCKEYRRRMAQ